MLTFCTAGHIDHGKSSLVKSLTGIDPDRLPEEKNRGMTIDLGFAWMQAFSGEMVGIVDVPGHKQFVRNVIPGMGNIDAAILVIAADDGWMPQSEEHTQIMDLLGVKHGIVALTKVDLVDDTAWLEMVEKDITTRLAQTSLQDAPIIRVSNKDCTGINKLKEAIDRLVLKIASNRDIGKPRLPIDRVFTMKGSGVVITGTLINGSLAPGDDVIILPDGLTAHIRSIESYKQKVDKALPGSRVALNLTGIKREKLKRGDIIMPHKAKVSRIANVEIRLLPGPTKLKNNNELLVYLETSELTARLVLIGAKDVKPQEATFAQLRFEKDVAMYIGERFILRNPSPVCTIGGGIILDPFATKYRVKDAYKLSTFIGRRRGLSLEELILTEVEKLKYAERGELLKASCYSSAEIDGCVNKLIAQSKLMNIASYIVGVDYWQELANRLLEALRLMHKSNPLKESVSQAALMACLNLPRTLFSQLISYLVNKGEIVHAGDSIAIAKHKPKLSSWQEAVISNIKELFTKNPASPPTLKELASQIPGSEEIIRFMCRENILVEIGDGIFLDARHYQDIKRGVIDFLTKKGRITIQDFNSLFGFSRKYTIPILTALDKEGITRREGDIRVLV